MDHSDKATWSNIGTGSLMSHGQFPSPFRDLAGRYTPRTMKDALWLCEYLYLNFGLYRKASERVVDYFLTKVIFKGQDDDERAKFDKLMTTEFGVIERLKELGYDLMCYGNSFASLHLPFTRVLRCKGCQSERNMINNKGIILPFQFNSSDFSFHARCPKCKRIQRHMVHDYAKRSADKIKLVRWDPKKITVEPNEISGDVRYWLDIDPTIIAKVRRGDPFILATLPWEFIAAIKRNEKFLFDTNYFFHLKEANLAGLHLGGWGIPSVLSAFKNFFRLQVLYRYDEVMKMDYIVPIRILSPAEMKVPAGNDFMGVGLGNFVQAASQAVQRHRIDGADWNFFPFPVNYQAIGGEESSLDAGTRDIISAEEDRLLNTRGIAPELYRGNLTLQNAPVGLRLFEASHTSLVAGLNRAVQWMSAGVSKYMNSGDHESMLESPKITDNLDDKAWRIQAGMTGAISKETAFSPMGVDAREEEKRVIQEQIRQQKEQQKAQQDAQMEAMTLDAPQSSDGGGQAGGSEMDPNQLESQADEMARSLLDPTLPEQNRRQQLASLRNTNDTLHALVIKKMDQYRDQAGTAGRQQGLQQMGIGGGQAKLGTYEGLHKLAQIRRMAHSFFPTPGHHKLGFTQDQADFVLTLSLREGSIPFILKQADVDQHPGDLMVRIHEALQGCGFSFN